MSETVKTPEPQDLNATPTEEATSPQVEKKTPSKRPRLSFIERAQKESEELVKTMGGTLEIEGGRRTRSSARGTPTRAVVETPPPTKKTRNTAASPKAATPRGRGRGRKIEASVTPEPPESKADETEKLEEKEEALKERKEDSTAEAEKPAEKAKTNESSETNGPEKSEAENVTDASTKTEESKPAKVAGEDKVDATQTKEKKKTAVVKESKPIDEVDASVLETIKERETEPEKVVEEKKESKKIEEPVASAAVVGTPMDVDEKSQTEAQIKATENAEKSIEPSSNLPEPTVAEKTIENTAAAIEKEPTPEPMDVDSSSESSDVVEYIDLVDKADEKTTVVSNAVKSSNVETIDLAPSPSPPPQTPKEKENNLSVEINANVKAKANDIPAVKSNVETATAGEALIDNNKNENDVDQQKIASASQLNVNAVAAAVDAPATVVPTSL